MDIVEFLRARLDEDAHRAQQAWAMSNRPDEAPRLRRAEREVEAKRRIVGLGWHHLGDEEYGWGMEEAKRQILGIVASVYADHPDYDKAWDTP